MQTLRAATRSALYRVSPVVPSGTQYLEPLVPNTQLGSTEETRPI